MTSDRFLALARRADSERALVPVWRDILLDTDTPVSAFAKLRRGPFAFLLESAPAGGETWARYTFLGTEPRGAWRLRDGVVDDWSPTEGWHGARRPADPIADLRARLLSHTPVDVPELGGFWSGAVGYFGYDVVRLIERLPHPPRRVLDAPDALLVLTRAVVIIDNLRARARIVIGVPVDLSWSDTALRAACEEAEHEIDGLASRLREPIEMPALDVESPREAVDARSSIRQSDFEAGVRRIKEYIHAGDAFQVLLARRLEMPLDFDPATLYRALRALNPSPYMYHLVLDGVELVGSSPELLVRVVGDRITVRPIAGTRARGLTPDEDTALAAELLADEKERAEHVMLVDLGRNDVGRVARYGSVEVSELFGIERYSHVLHLVSQVDGALRLEHDALDALRATFPAGTMTGAPKVRAMEIIDELEPERRGPYAGAVGYIAAGASRMDLAITIRTCVIAGGVASVSAGAGIVADSVPEREWEETENKARALLLAMGMARHPLEAGAGARHI
ncbi:MAG TPA: chorismate-binding protein [Gemmatimonadaceae bacterium]|nr:chorismate-binding protein [Gemmatimonadaceae bacterium]